MKKIIGILIVSLFVIGAVCVPALKNTPTQTTEPKKVTNFTHAVFAEDGTATWCGYCHYARAALNWVYNNDDYPFYYVCLIDDMNTHADSRIMEYNIQGYPTVFFDGGNVVEVGGWTGAQAAYEQDIETAGPRAVSDINTSLNVNWLGSGNMDITVNIHNNNSASYTGKLKVYVVENIASQATWKDTTGHQYTMAFLDYAQNQAVTVGSGTTWSNTYTWTGSEHNDGHGHNFGNCQSGNLMVIAVVFNNTMHQGYSYPPSGGPFNAYYVDDCVGFQVGTFTNQPPAAPSNPSPADGTTDVSCTKTLSWTCTDPTSDILKYDVYFGTTNPPPLKASQQDKASYNPGRLDHLTTYYWQIVAFDEWGNSVNSPLWSFTTVVDRPPVQPYSPQPADGAINVPINKDLSWSCSDPDPQETVHYDVYFGVTNPPPLVASHLTDKTYDPGNMVYNTTYYWIINATDGTLYNASPLWSFTTGKESDTTPPSLTIVKPLAGYIYKNDAQVRKRIFFSNALIFKQITILVNASDSNGIAKVEFYIDSALKNTSTHAPYSYLWDTSSGLFHTIKIVAYDGSGNTAQKSISVTRLG